MSEQEQWRPIPDFPDYRVSNQGRVLSHKRKKPRELVGNLDRHGYRKVTLVRDGRQFSRSVHTLVAEAFCGPRPARSEVRHLDGNALNNAAPNLRFGSRSDNVLDTVRHGTHPQASKTHCKWGHEFTPENTYRAFSGHRQCRTCQRAGVRRYAIRRQFAAANIKTTETAA